MIMEGIGMFDGVEMVVHGNDAILLRNAENNRILVKLLDLEYAASFEDLAGL